MASRRPPVYGSTTAIASRELQDTAPAAGCLVYRDAIRTMGGDGHEGSGDSPAHLPRVYLRRGAEFVVSLKGQGQQFFGGAMWKAAVFLLGFVVTVPPL